MFGGLYFITLPRPCLTTIPTTTIITTTTAIHATHKRSFWLLIMVLAIVWTPDIHRSAHGPSVYVNKNGFMKNDGETAPNIHLRSL